MQIDTPDSNYPPPLNLELIAVVMPVLDKIDHNVTSRIFGEPLAQARYPVSLCLLLNSISFLHSCCFLETWPSPFLRDKRYISLFTAEEHIYWRRHCDSRARRL